MKRILSVGLLVLLLVISWVMPVSAHDEGHEDDGDDFALSTCPVPFPTLDLDEQPELDFYELLIYGIEMSGVEEIWPATLSMSCFMPANIRLSGIRWGRKSRQLNLAREVATGTSISTNRYVRSSKGASSNL